MQRLVMVVVSAVILAGCANPRVPAPVENRSVSKTYPLQRTPTGQFLEPAPPGFYRVQQGDTVIGISLDHGLTWRDLAAWNQLDNANRIEPNQLLRVIPPNSVPQAAVRPPVSAFAEQSASSASAGSSVGSSPASPAASGPAKSRGEQAAVTPLPGSETVARPLDAKPSTPAKAAGSAPAPSAPSTVGPVASVSPSVPSAPAPSAPASAETRMSGSLSWGWPGNGRVITQFADPGYKGIALEGAEGDPVMAANDGRVVYSGSGLRGYGNLVIVKHEGDFLTAYAHNKSILVKEGQTVKRGQKIAELGATDSDVAKLHFEVRKAGKPVDPLTYLPPR
jgi:lipoprotein NlpD